MHINEETLKGMMDNGYDKWLEKYLISEAREVQLDAGRLQVEREKIARQESALQQRLNRLKMDQERMTKMKEWRRAGE